MTDGFWADWAIFQRAVTGTAVRIVGVVLFIAACWAALTGGAWLFGKVIH